MNAGPNKGKFFADPSYFRYLGGVEKSQFLREGHNTYRKAKPDGTITKKAARKQHWENEHPVIEAKKAGRKAVRAAKRGKSDMTVADAKAQKRAAVSAARLDTNSRFSEKHPKKAAKLRAAKDAGQKFVSGGGFKSGRMR